MQDDDFCDGDDLRKLQELCYTQNKEEYEEIKEEESLTEHKKNIEKFIEDTKSDIKDLEPWKQKYMGTKYSPLSFEYNTKQKLKELERRIIELEKERK